MSKKKILAILTGTATVATAIAAYEAKKKADKTTYEANLIEPIKKRKRGIYEKYIKRALDVICATGAIVVFSPVYLGVAVLVKLKLGSPVLFTQDRPGLIGKDGRETVFKMYKFRTMTDERDENGELLPDEARLTKFGKWLRNTSLDELPEAFNILNGTMSVIGPRPQLVRDISNVKKTCVSGIEECLKTLLVDSGLNTVAWGKIYKTDYFKNVRYPIGKYHEDIYTTYKLVEKCDKIVIGNRCSCISDFEMLNGKYDVFIVGSDQIWSPLSYDVRYFFDYINNPGKLISYAPSIGVNSIQDKYIEKNMKKYISRFNKISCREKVGAEMIGKLVERDIEEVVDPTLLLSASEWKQELKLKQTEKQYLLVYFLGTNKKYWEKVYEVSKILNLSLKIIPVYEKDKMRAGVIDESIGPREFVEYFYNASFVCTDSFHGTAFSLIFNKKMLVFERFSNKEKENQNSRIYNILSKFNLKNRLYNESTYQHEIMEEINYQCVNEILTKCIKYKRLWKC